MRQRDWTGLFVVCSPDPPGPAALPTCPCACARQRRWAVVLIFFFFARRPCNHWPSAVAGPRTCKRGIQGCYIHTYIIPISYRPRCRPPWSTYTRAYVAAAPLGFHKKLRARATTRRLTSPNVNPTGRVVYPITAPRRYDYNTHYALHCLRGHRAPPAPRPAQPSRATLPCNLGGA